MKRILLVFDDDLYNEKAICKVRSCFYFLFSQYHFNTFFEFFTNFRKCWYIHYSVGMAEYFNQMKSSLCEKCRNVSHTYTDTHISYT